MFMTYFNSLNRENSTTQTRQDDDVFDESMFKESIKVDLQQAKNLFSSLLKQQPNRKVSSLTVYYLGIVYLELNDMDTAKRYFNHLVLNYQEQTDLIKRAKKKLASL